MTPIDCRQVFKKQQTMSDNLSLSVVELRKSSGGRHRGAESPRLRLRLLRGVHNRSGGGESSVPPVIRALVIIFKQL